MKLGALVLAVGLLWSVSAFSDGFQTGNALYEKCNADHSSVEFAYCIGYVAGLADAFGQTNVVCPTQGVELLQAVDVVVKYLRDHPESRHYDAGSEGRLALQPAFPCK